MKDIFERIKYFITDTWIGLVAYCAVGILFCSGFFEGTIIGNILNVIAIIGGIALLGGLAIIFIVLIYTFIKLWFKDMIRNEISSYLFEQKIREMQINKENKK